MGLYKQKSSSLTQADHDHPECSQHEEHTPADRPDDETAESRTGHGAEYQGDVLDGSGHGALKYDSPP